jgi:hypothetical protein
MLCYLFSWFRFSKEPSNLFSSVFQMATLQEVSSNQNSVSGCISHRPFLPKPPQNTVLSQFQLPPVCTDYISYGTLSCISPSIFWHFQAKYLLAAVLTQASYAESYSRRTYYLIGLSILNCAAPVRPAMRWILGSILDTARHRLRTVSSSELSLYFSSA